MEESKEKIKCCLCGEVWENCVIFHNGENKSFKYIPENSGAHLECYLKEVIRIYQQTPTSLPPTE